MWQALTIPFNIVDVPLLEVKCVIDADGNPSGELFQFPART